MDVTSVILNWLAGNLGLITRVIAAALVIVASYYIAKFLFRRVMGLRIRGSPEMLYNIGRAVKWGTVFIGVLIALTILGIELTGLMVAAGFAGIVVGLAAQQTLGQLFSGISLLLEGRVRVGDAIKLDDDWGLVESVGLMSTQIRLWSGEILTVPNSYIMSSKTYNYSRSVARRANFTIGISYSSDVGKALDIIRSVLNENPLVLAEPAPTLIVDSLGESSVNINVLFWVPSQEFWTVRREIIKDVKKALEDAGIEIPFPQRVVWLRGGVKG